MQYLLLKDLMIYLFLSDYMDIIEDVSNAIIKASTNLSEDKFNALKKAISVEDNENALWALNQILENYEIRAKTYRVYHKRSIENVIGTAIGWLSESLKMLGCTPSVPAVGIGRTHYEASSLLLKSIVYGNLDSQSDLENYVTQKLNETNIGPLGFGGKTTVLGSFVNVGNQRASGVRIVSVRPSCFVEPRVATLHL